MADRQFTVDLLGRDVSLSSAADKAADSIEGLGDELESTAKSGKRLDEQISDTERRLRGLAQEFARTDDAAARMDLTKSMRKAQTEQRQLIKVRDLLPDDAEVAKGGASFGKTLGSSITRFTAQAISSAGPILGIAAAGAAPFIGAAISGAVVGGAAGVGIIGGVLLASKDARVKSAFAGVAQEAERVFQHAAEPFVPATLRAVGQVNQALYSIRPVLQSIFKNTAGYLDPLTRGVTIAVRAIADGLEDATAKAGPVVSSLSTGVAQLGTAVGGFLTTVSQNATAGAQALTAMFNVISVGINYLSTTTNALSKVFEWTLKLGGGGLPQLTGAYDVNKSAASGASNASMGFQKALDVATGSVRTQTTAIRTLAEITRQAGNANLSLDEAQTRAAQSTAEARKAIEKNGQALSNNTERGRENRQTLQNLARAYMTQIDAQEKSTGAGAALTATQQRLRGQFIAAATAATGNARAAKDLADRYFGIPEKVNTRARFDKNDAAANASGFYRQLQNVDGTVARTSATFNAGGARTSVRNLRQALDSIPRNISVSVTVRSTNNQTSPSQGSAIRQRASGGPVEPNTPYLVGEEGPEIVMPREHGTVLNANVTRSLMANARGGRAAGARGGMAMAGAGAPTINVYVSPGGNLADAGRQMADALTEWYRVSGQRP